jgi:hypothetical protein
VAAVAGLDVARVPGAIAALLTLLSIMAFRRQSAWIVDEL